MKVTILASGKHLFNLARQLERKGYLDSIFTSYPWFAVKDSKLPRDKVNCLISKEILERGLIYKMPYLIKKYLSKKIDIPYFIANLFDNQVAKRIKPCDIFVGSSGYSLHTIRKIRKSFPAKVIIEQVSSHIQVCWDILIQEQERLGIKLSLFPSCIIEKKLEEYREADYIVVPSTLVKQTFLDKGFSQDKIICVPYGVDIETFKPIPKNDHTFRIISIGISVRKGTHYLLQAIDELKIKDLELWLIGRIDSSIKSFLKKYSRCFRYLGGIPKKKLYEYYSQGSISVLFSLEEGLPYALLEAMACGLPVICSDKTSAKDVVREGIDGFVIPTGDVKTLKEKILYLYENPHICQGMGRQAQENITKNFTWDNYGERIVNTYLNLLK